MLTALLMTTAGRKPILVINLFMVAFCTAVACVMSINNDHEFHDHFFIIVLMVAVKMCVASNLSVLKVYTSEIFPTNIRATALGAMLSFSSVGAILSPWLDFMVERLVEENHLGRHLVLGMVSVMAGAVVSHLLLLPHSLGWSLPPAGGHHRLPSP